MPVAGETTHVRRLTTLSMARFRSKSCSETIKLIVKGAGEVCEIIVESESCPGTHGHRRRQVWGQRPGQHS